MRLLLQPEDGVLPVLKAIRRARRSIDLHVFRLDVKEIEKALAAAVARGVVVRTLVAHTNARGEEALRKLEQRLLGLGATVSRTADDLVRYHGKMMIVDASWLYVFAFNLTHLDMERSRSFGVATRKRALVQEALRLFQADFDRKPYEGGVKDFVVSPVNSRERLARYLSRAKRQLLIYDEALTDDEMIRVLEARVKAGVELRIIGHVEKGHEIEAEPLAGKRQHVRSIVCDGRSVFLGSQSLRRLELDGRREIGVVVRDRKVVRAISDVFEADWAKTRAGRKAARVAKKRAGDGDRGKKDEGGSGERSDGKRRRKKEKREARRRGVEPGGPSRAIARPASELVVA
jgi:phosphatidylserine/phosphatidylglycerophosphate/cardiolipin synthase-like enzyme